MNWEKKGLIFSPSGKYDWSQSHAQLPIVDINSAGVWRIYYATRNRAGQSNISYIETEPGNPQNILYIHPEPLLPFGVLGSFDESGLMPVSIISFDKKKYLYYAGWSLQKTIPYHNTIGLAISGDGGKTFQKYGEGPIFDRTPFEPFSNGTIHILIDNEKWKAWYQSITRWETINNRVEPFYHIKYAESNDGINWERKPAIAIDFKNFDEAGICSASVVHEDQQYCMWYAHRKKGNYRQDKELSYRIGYAESEDGQAWIRKDELAGIEISKEGWDSEMITYPNVVIFEGKKYLFYNGNGFGATGFGYAVMP